jgi:hypothetical protein
MSGSKIGAIEEQIIPQTVKYHTEISMVTIGHE